MGKISTRDHSAIAARLGARESFDTHGALSGEGVVRFGVSRGMMPRGVYDVMVSDDPDYAVWSYGTVIAYHCGRGWVIPDVKYSCTTSRHQGGVRYALAIAGEDYSEA